MRLRLVTCCAVGATLTFTAAADANSVVSSKRILASYLRVATVFSIDQPPHCVPDEYGLLPTDCFEWEYQLADLDFRVLRRTPRGRWVRVYASSTPAIDGRNVERVYGFEVRGGWRCGRYRLRTVLVDPYDRGTTLHVLPFRRRC